MLNQLSEILVQFLQSINPLWIIGYCVVGISYYWARLSSTKIQWRYPSLFQSGVNLAFYFVTAILFGIVVIILWPMYVMAAIFARLFR